MAFDKQVFISYAHIDNEPLTANQQGWITRFHATLSAMLSMRLGRKAEIWRDIKLSGNDIFADEIIQQFPKTALLISVLTPRYVESEWCTREVKEFCKTAETTGGILVDNKSRVLKVIKIPFDNSELIKKMEAHAAASAAAPAVAAKPTVYLADCSYDRREDREAVQADLRLHGYPILAEVQLPTDEATFLGELAAIMGRSKLSVHIIGDNYGVVPDGPSEKSVTVLENELAIQFSKKLGLRRIIWLPSGTKCDSPRQQEFIDLLLRDPQAQLGADLITGDLEELKAAIHAALKKFEKPPPPPAPKEAVESGTKLVYLICDERDRKTTVPLRKFLKTQGFETNMPLFEGDAATVRQSNQDLLSACDAAIIFYGTGDEAWKRSIDAELRKAAGYRTSKTPLAPFTYLAEPATNDKTDLVDMEEPRLIDCLKGFSEPTLAEFVNSVSGKAKS